MRNVLTKPSRAGRTLRQRGMSIIELLVGVAVGMIVVAGAVKLMMDTLGSNRQLLLETRVNQDLRAAADLIARDIRRAGYWTNSISGVFTGGTGAVPTNPYRDITLDSNVIDYQYSRDNTDTIEDAERAGFRLTNGVLEFRNGAGSWQAITDPKVVNVTSLTITPLATSRTSELYPYCSCMSKLTCEATDFQGTGTHASKRLVLTIEQFDIALVGQATSDVSVQREIRESVRVRNDKLANPTGGQGCCPNPPTVPLGCCPDPANPSGPPICS
jgi:type IV pilus assembly protein PilW